MFALLAGVSLSACKGPEGPTGPQGPAGPPGQARVVSGIVPSGGGLSIALPVEAGLYLDTPPAMACYISNNQNDVWLSVADGDGDNSAYCGLVFDDGRYYATILRAPVGWTAMFVVTY